MKNSRRSSPEPAGEWRWIGPRALQFRPAEPWKPLARVVVKSGSSETRLVALLPTPCSTTPADGADPIPELTQIALTFPAPVEAKALARLLAIEMRPSPGISPRGGRVLSSADFDIRPLERSKRSAEQSYVIKFREAIADGQLAVMRLKLADEPGLDEETFELRVRTATPFAVADTSCGRGWNDDKIDGVLRCASNGAARRRPRAARKKAATRARNMRPPTSGACRCNFPPSPRRSTFCARAKRCASRRPSTILPSRSIASA